MNKKLERLFPGIKIKKSFDILTDCFKNKSIKGNKVSRFYRVIYLDGSSQYFIGETISDILAQVKDINQVTKIIPPIKHFFYSQEELEEI